MARPIEYDKTEFLKKSTLLFLSRGFEGTSLRDIFETTGMNRHSLYHHFGDKQGLYLEVMDYYEKNNFVPLYTILEKDPLGLTSIEAFFEAILSSKNKVNCVMLHTLLERTAMDKQAIKIATKHFTRLEKGFLDNLNVSITNKEINSDVNIDKASSLLIGFLHGLPTSSALKGNKKNVRGGQKPT